MDVINDAEQEHQAGTEQQRDERTIREDPEQAGDEREGHRDAAVQRHRALVPAIDDGDRKQARPCREVSDERCYGDSGEKTDEERRSVWS